MAEAKEVYICEVCGNQVEKLIDGGGELVCCGEPMKLLDKSDPRSASPAHELVVEEIPGGYRVLVGNPNRHAMTEAHYMQWIEAWVGNRVCRKELKPGDEPVAEFMLADIAKEQNDTPRFRAYCNLHGIRYSE